MIATVKAGERGVDFSFARPPAARLRELGYTFVVGYVSVPPASQAKNISKEECEAYIAAGLKVLLVWEMSATRPSLGAPYGTTDGRNAKLLAAARGYPTDVPILVADDTNTVATNIDAHEAYMRAFADACQPFPIGIYGDTDILARCAGLWRIGWVPNAWSWSGTSRKDAEAKAKAVGAHVLQRTGYWVDDRWAVDPNDVIKDFPAWGTGANPLPDPPGDDDMIDIVTNAETRNGENPLHAKFAVMDDGTVRGLSGVELKARKIVNDLALGVPMSNAELDRMGTYTPGGDSVDPVARDLIVKLNDAVGRTGQAVGDIQSGLIKAGGG